MSPSEVTRKKRPLTPEEHAACDAAIALRKKMGLSQRQMARQVGTSTRSVNRWERHLCVPQDRHLVRLEQLQRMVDEPTGERPAFFHDGRKRPKTGKELGYRLLVSKGRQLIGALLARLGGRVVIEKHELAPWQRSLKFWRSGDSSFTLEMDERVAERIRKNVGGVS